MTPGTKQRPSNPVRLRTGIPLALILLQPWAPTLMVGSGCAHHQATIVEQPRPLVDFTALDLGPGFSAQVQAGGPFAVTVRGDARFLPHVKTRVERGTLVVHMSDLVAVRPDVPMAVIVRLPSVDRLVVTGSELSVTGLTGASMTLHATAGSRVRASGVNGQRLALTVTDRSSLHIAGTVEDLRADVSGASQVHARQLQAEHTRAAVTSDARLELRQLSPTPVQPADGVTQVPTMTRG